MYYLESLFIDTPSKTKVKGGPKIGYHPYGTPLFNINASLSSPEILLTPLPHEMYKFMVKFIRSIVDSSKYFHRWMNGTCIISPPQKQPDDDEPFYFSFHMDLIANQSIISMVTSLNNTISKTFNAVQRWTDTWRKYRPLWKTDKNLTLEKFAQKHPNAVQYDEKLAFYSKMARDVEMQVAIKDIAFVRVFSTSLQKSIYEEAQQWVLCIGIIH